LTSPSGFEDYVTARRDQLVRTAYLLTGDAHQAEDLVQTALIRVWPRWQRISEVENVDAYVRRTLFTVFVTSIRRRRWRELTTDPHDASWSVPTADDIVRAEHRVDLRGFLGGLAPRQRAVIVLRYYLDLSEAEAASILGCSVGTVKSQSAKALKRLRATPAVAAVSAEGRERG
jgi:RNA polymerase sigma-70 factor (sigma-E family)